MGFRYQFYIYYIISDILGITLIVLMFVWILKYQEGFSWSSDPHLQFNWHPALMTIALFLYAQSILVYRIFTFNYKIRKISHAVIHFIVFILYIVALKAVFDSHNLIDPAINNMYSLHSWIGLSATILFAFEYVIGFITFLYPGLKDPQYIIKSANTHVHIGLLGFILGILEILSGLYDKIFFIFTPDHYRKLEPEAVLINMMGVVLVVYGMLVIYLVNNKRFKSLITEIPEDEPNQITN